MEYNGVITVVTQENPPLVKHSAIGDVLSTTTQYAFVEPDMIRTLSDDAIADIQRLVTKIAPHKKVDRELLNQVASSSRLLLAHITADDQRLNVEKVVGMATLAVSSTGLTGPTGHIVDIVVDEEYQNQGIATNMVKEMISEAQGNLFLEELYMTCRSTRNPIRHLAARLGFEGENMTINTMCLI